MDNAWSWSYNELLLVISHLTHGREVTGIWPTLEYNVSVFNPKDLQ